jgi:PAS domain-containing protein
MTQLSTDRSPLFERQTATDDTAGAAPSNADATPDTLPQLFEKVERAKQEWEATIDSLPELVCVLDEQGRVLRASRAIEAWELAKVTQVHGRNFHQLMHPNCFGPFCDLYRFLEEARQTTPVDRAAELELADPILDRYLRLRVQTVAARDKIRSTTVVVVQDITYQKTVEAAMQRYTARLEAMTELQRAILSARSPEEIAQAALTRLRQLLPFCQARIVLQATEAADCLVLAADANGSTHLRPSQLCTWRDLGVTDAHLLESVQVVDDLSARSEVSPLEQQLLDERVRSYCSVPLVADGDFVGLLLIAAARPGVF